MVFLGKIRRFKLPILTLAIALIFGGLATPASANHTAPSVSSTNVVNIQNTSAKVVAYLSGPAYSPTCVAVSQLATNQVTPSLVAILQNTGTFVARIQLTDRGAMFDGTLSGLAPGTDYLSYVACENVFGETSNVISRAFTTTGSAQQSVIAPSYPTPAFTINSRPAVSANGQMLTLNGENLGDVTGVKVAGKDAKISKKANGELVIEVPAGTEGFPDVEVIHAGGTVSMQGLIQVIKPYAQVRTQTITQFVGNRPTLAGIAALEQAYLAGTTANVLTCVATVASDASSATITKATARAEATCGRIVKYAKYIKVADVHISKDGAAGSKPVLAITFDRTLGGK